uniref:POTRA domain-containing protein n=1 Tax=Dasya binghamiae TaxID=1896963 RepID=A0A1C8XSD1_9FLOR|nr:hypothetical protein BI108_pgp054 [Dasya binghamiae]AOH77353.1 hypothetical protein [Dasya binghamiae]
MFLLYFFNYPNQIPISLYYLSFNINLIYKSENFNINKKLNYIYFLGYNSNLIKYNIKLPINNLKKTKVNRNFGIELITQIKQSGYFNTIEYTNWYMNQSKYIIFNLKSNSIIKKVKINNYKNLKIPKNLLIKIFKHQVGLPVNYKYIKNSINEIYKWYKLRGFQWAKIHYINIDKKNEINIIIFEGNIFQSYCIYDQLIKNKKDLNYINTLNLLIKKELCIIPGYILNINNLELKIRKLKNKYSINNLKYKVEHKSKGLVITIKYNLANYKKLSIYDKKKIRSKLLYYIQYVKKYKNFNNQPKVIRKLTLTIYKIINDFFSNSNNIFQIYYYDYFYLKYNTFIINLLFNITFNNKFFNASCYIFYPTVYKYSYLIINILLKIRFNHIKIYECFWAQYKNIKSYYLYHYIYSYFIQVFNIALKLNFQYLSKIEIIQYLTGTFYTYNKKHYLIYIYNNIFNYRTNYDLIYLNREQKNILLIYKIKIKYNYLYLIPDHLLKIKQLLSLYYNIYVKLNTESFNNNYSYKFYLHNLEINYQKLYKIPKIVNYYQTLNVITKCYIILGSLNTNILQSLHNKFNIIVQIEYQLYMNKNNCLYLYLKYTSLINKIYTFNNYYNKYQYISTGLGIQINIPIQYIPNIRLELQIDSLNKYLFYCYIKPLFYK